MVVILVDADRRGGARHDLAEHTWHSATVAAPRYAPLSGHHRHRLRRRGRTGPHARRRHHHRTGPAGAVPGTDRPGGPGSAVLPDRAGRQGAAGGRGRAGVARRGERLPLLGVPIAIKDDVDVADEFTCYGSSVHGSAPTADAEVVRRLRAAGAVILGQDRGAGDDAVAVHRDGRVRGHPQPVGRVPHPGGSSGGSAAAVAAGLAPMALGSDGAGSIRIPSTWWVFGIKPQRDRCRWHRTTTPGAA